MLFSIIVPFKETNIKYIQNCIESLENQYFKEFEAIFIYNHSNLLEQLLRNSPLNYKLINVESPSNISISRNKGLAAAEGENILFLDNDDFLHPNALIYAKKVIDSETAEVIRMKISKTHFDKKTSFNKINQAFYKINTSEILNQVFNDLKVSITSEQKEDLINELFEKNVLNFNYTEITKNKLFKALTYPLKVHGFIFNKKFLINNNIFFDEMNDLYGEIPFLIQVYNNTVPILQTSVNLYYKLIHNDPVNHPSLSQETYTDRSLQYCKALNHALIHCDDLTISKQIKLKAIKYYLYRIVKEETFFESFNQNYPLYQKLQNIFNTPSDDIKLVKRHKKEIEALKKGKFKQAYFLSKTRVFGYKLFQFLKPKQQRYRQKKIQKHVFTKLAIRPNTIVYESFLGRNYSDSPKALFQYLLKHQPNKWKHIWILNDKHIVDEEIDFNHKNVKIIKRFSWKYFYYVTISKFFVLNMRQPKWLKKKDEQILLSTWHGTPLKRLVFDMENVASANPKYKLDFYQQSRNWDYLIAANKYSENIFESAFMYPKDKILTYGYPRNDILTNHTEDRLEKIKTKLKIPSSKKVILYAPTWRDDEYHKVGQYKFNLTLDLNLLKQELEEEYIIVLRMHYFISDNIDLSDFEGFAYDYSKYNDINDLFIISDMLITDYSSVFFDFANLKRPILFFTYDMEKYKGMLRGFYIDMENDLPGPLLYTSEEVLNSVKNIEQVEKKFSLKYANFYDTFCSLDDGNATKRVVKTIFEKN